MFKKTAVLILVMLLVFTTFFCFGDELLEVLYPTPDFVQELLGVAREEIGYKEGKNNYSKYGEWYGDPYAQWCAEFLCWCVDQVDQRFSRDLLKRQYPLYGGSNVGRDWFIKEGRYIDKRGYLEGWGYQWKIGTEEYIKKSYIPQPGDWMFFTWRSGPDTDHVAMVEYCTKDSEGEIWIHVIEGNNPAAVARNIYSFNDTSILGYGTVIQVANTTMRFGNRGKGVKQLQAKLHDLGYLDDRHITGVFRTSTRGAIREFQEKYEDLKVNGVANIETQTQLDTVWQEWIEKDFSKYLVIDE